jgi:hypothetical protein
MLPAVPNEIGTIIIIKSGNDRAAYNRFRGPIVEVAQSPGAVDTERAVVVAAIRDNLAQFVLADGIPGHHVTAEANNQIRAGETDVAQAPLSAVTRTQIRADLYTGRRVILSIHGATPPSGLVGVDVPTCPMGRTAYALS